MERGGPRADLDGAQGRCRRTHQRGEQEEGGEGQRQGHVWAEKYDREDVDVLVMQDDILVGAVMINRIEQGGVLRSLIENRVPIRLPPEALIAPGFNFGQLLP